MSKNTKHRSTSCKKNVKILFTCIGRRVSLLNCFKSAAKKLEINAAFYGTDSTKLSPALQLCDKKFIVKPVEHPQYISQLLNIVKKNKITLLIPTVDLDLILLAKNKSRFERCNCRILVSEPQVIEICQDKRKTRRFLKKNGFDTPATVAVSTALSKNNIKWPCFLKPWDGYAGRGNAVVNNKKELRFFAKTIPNCIVQEFIRGTEYTCDAYVDFDMNVRCVVPRKRIQVRAGEVSKGQTVKNKQIMKQAANLVSKLHAGPGIITLQLFLTKENQIKFIEINPRFGGGAPLSIKAGAEFPKWILQETFGKKPVIPFDAFEHKLTMLRYDNEVWMHNTKKE